jgi:hypothetical protein
MDSFFALFTFSATSTDAEGVPVNFEGGGDTNPGNCVIA